MKLSARNLVAYCFALVLIGLGRVKKARKRAMNGEFILSIYFHNPSKEEFESILKWMIGQKFHFISLADLKRIIKGEVEVPKGAVLITVDDGWRLNVSNIVEVANNNKVPIAIFISTEPVEKGAFWWSYVKAGKYVQPNLPTVSKLKKISNEKRLSFIEGLMDKVSVSREAMTSDQIVDISKSDYITIGGHTHSHPILINCTDEELREELLVCKEKIESWIGKKVDAFAFPNGDFNEREVAVLKELEYELGFANAPKYLVKDKFNKPYEIPRFGFLEGASFAENRCRMVGVWKFRK